MNNIKAIYNKCTACFACIEMCPQKCIHVEKNSEGFLYPKIDDMKCIDCGKCLRHCHASLSVLPQSYEKFAVWGKVKNENLFSKSSSGGAFSAIVYSMQNLHPILYGAIMDKDNYFYVNHVRREIDSYGEMCKSKYVISDMNGIYPSIKRDLEKGKEVLFTGTPCQVSGLKVFLGKEHEKLTTIDFICHGVPSAQIFNDHLKYIEKSSGQKISKIDFRSKKLGWRKYCLFMEFEGNSTYLQDIRNDYYLHIFMEYQDLRLSCYSCQYSNEKHQSEVTLADFWGINKYKPEFDNDTGLSLIVANNEKGYNVVEKILNAQSILDYENINKEKYKYIYKEHTYYPKQLRNRFFKNYKCWGYEKLANKYKKQIYIEDHSKIIYKLAKKINYIRSNKLKSKVIIN